MHTQKYQFTNLDYRAEQGLIYLFTYFPAPSKNKPFIAFSATYPGSFGSLSSPSFQEESLLLGPWFYNL